MARPSCKDCVRKHIAQAIILLDEAQLGYSAHKWLAVGHLAEAESESLETAPNFSKMIREKRKQITEGSANAYLMDLLKSVDDFEFGCSCGGHPFEDEEEPSKDTREISLEISPMSEEEPKVLEAPISFPVGARVRSPTAGEGIVANEDGMTILVRFDEEREDLHKGGREDGHRYRYFDLKGNDYLHGPLSVVPFEERTSEDVYEILEDFYFNDNDIPDPSDLSEDYFGEYDQAAEQLIAIKHFPEEAMVYENNAPILATVDNVSIGTRVRSKVYGVGTVYSVNKSPKGVDLAIYVEFDEENPELYSPQPGMSNGRGFSKDGEWMGDQLTIEPVTLGVLFG